MLINLRKKIKSQKGFTLVELMVVIAIIGVLAAIAVPKLSNSTDSAKKAKILADLRTIDSANAVHYADKGNYAADVATLKTDGYLANEPTPQDYGGKTVSGYSVVTTPTTDDNYGRTYVTIGSTKYYATSTLP